MDALIVTTIEQGSVARSAKGCDPHKVAREAVSKALRDGVRMAVQIVTDKAVETYKTGKAGAMVYERKETA